MPAKICHRKATSNTGLVGITETTRRGRPCFTVSWRPARGVRKATTVYYGRTWTREAALNLAVAVRNVMVRERARKEPMR